MKCQCFRWLEIFTYKSKHYCLITYSKKSSSLKTNLWNSFTLLWKFEIINKKFRYFQKPNILNHMLGTIQLHSSNTRDTCNKNEIPIFRQKRKKILLHWLILPKKQVFIWKQNKVNCITLILLQYFMSIFGVFLLINPKRNTIILKDADYNSKNFLLLKK